MGRVEGKEQDAEEAAAQQHVITGRFSAPKQVVEQLL